MLNSVIRFSLRQPLLIIALAVLVLIVGSIETSQLPIDVFPDLNRPRVVIMTEAPGYAPEEVETLINVPLEKAFNGAAGVDVVRSDAGIGLSIIFVEFHWDTDLYIDRQIVAERLAVARESLPEGIQPQMGPVASIMGQIMLIGMYVEPSEEGADDATSMLELRQYADWDVGRRLTDVDGVTQVFSMGGEEGGEREFQVLVNPNLLRQYGITLHQVETALAESNENATGGYLRQGTQTLLVRSLGRIQSIEDLDLLVIDGTREPPLLLRQVAEVREGASIAYGAAAIGVQDKEEEDKQTVQPAVMLVVVKQPGADTRKICSEIDDILRDIPKPEDVRIVPDAYRMDSFIIRAIKNVEEALLHGVILVVIVLFIFLMNFRTTFITLTAIPLSILVTFLIFRWFGLSINTMTLGGLAVAIGELVDDAIVDVENIYRRLRENRHHEKPRPVLRVIYDASVEVRSSIVFATMLVIIAFLPLLALGGIEGRLFRPLGIAYVVSILASLFVSLTVTPVLCYYLLPKAKFMKREREGPVLRGMQAVAGFFIRWSARHAWPVMIVVGSTAAIAVLIVVNMGRDFLPPFNEGSLQLSVFLDEGTSLEESNRIMAQVDAAVLQLDFVSSVARRTGRAEDDEHVHGVNFSELVIEFKPDVHMPRQEQKEAIRAAVDNIAGVGHSGRSNMEQPISHLMMHMLSGVKAQIAIKIYGDDLATLRDLAQEAVTLIEGTEGVEDLRPGQQVLIPQLQIRMDRHRLSQVGLRPGEVNHIVETAMKGRVVSTVLEGEATFDLIVRLDDPYRESIDEISQLALQLPGGGSVPLDDVADILPDRMGPNMIKRESTRRRIVVQCNTADDVAVSEVVSAIRERLKPLEKRLGTGYYIEYAGQFKSEEEARKRIALLSIGAVLGMFLVLYTLFHSVNLSLQVMSALPMAAIGAVAALIITGQNLSLPAIVGFISLAGIASRNGILLISHYLHLVRHEGEAFSIEMVVRAGKERTAPVLMTALTSGIGLLPLAFAAGEPGKEILYPVATVIIGGLMSSTLLDFFIHPALFWTFGRSSAEKLILDSKAEDGFGDSL